MSFPADLKYTKDHEWVRIEGNHATIGITSFAQGELGDIVFVEIETAGDDLGAHEIFGTVEAVKTVSDLYMPVTGTILGMNDALESDPQLVNTDPYGAGWMVEIELANESEIAGLLSADDYAAIVG